MTPAQRKARSRALLLGALAGELEQARRIAADWKACMEIGRPGATDADIEAAFQEIDILLASATLHIPRA